MICRLRSCGLCLTYAHLLLLPGSDVVAVRLLEFEALPAGEREDGLRERRSGRLRALERRFQIVDMEYHQRTAGPRRQIGAEASGETVIGEVGVIRAIVRKRPAEYRGIER